MIHYKPDAVTSLATPKTFENVAGGRDIKGRRLFVMEGTQARQVAALPAECHKILDDLLDPGSLNYLFYALPGDHLG
jgi:hypothetical protein